METHLAHEEADVLPLIPEASTPDDLSFLQAESAKTNPPPAFLPWLLDDAPAADLAIFTGPMPAPVRSQLESTWMPQRRARWVTSDSTHRSCLHVEVAARFVEGCPIQADVRCSPIFPIWSGVALPNVQTRHSRGQSLVTACQFATTGTTALCHQHPLRVPMQTLPPTL